MPYCPAIWLTGEILFLLCMIWSKSSAPRGCSITILSMRPAISRRMFPYSTRSSSVTSEVRSAVSVLLENPIAEDLSSLLFRSISKLPQKTKEILRQSIFAVCGSFRLSSFTNVTWSPSISFRNSFWMLLEKSVPPEPTIGSNSLSASSTTTIICSRICGFSSRKISLTW